MGYLSQEQSIFRRLTVEQNILAILEALPKSRTLGRKLSRRERWERTDGALAQFGLTEVRKTNSARCSGGEKRRLEIARALVCEPLMIMLDEPFAAVDPLTKTDIQGIVRDLARAGIAILVTDHDVDRVLEIADRVYLITEGTVRCHGTPGEIVRNPIALTTYLGDGTGRGISPARYQTPERSTRSRRRNWSCAGCWTRARPPVGRRVMGTSINSASASGLVAATRRRGLLERLGDDMIAAGPTPCCTAHGRPGCIRPRARDAAATACGPAAVRDRWVDGSRTRPDDIPSRLRFGTLPNRSGFGSHDRSDSELSGRLRC